MSNAAVDALVAVATSEIEAANAIATEVNAARGNHAKMVHEIREQSDDPRLVAYRDKREKQEAVMLKMREEADKIAAELSGVATLTDEQVAEKEAAYQDHAKAGKGAFGLIKRMVGEGDVPEVPELIRFKSGKSGAGAGTGTRRLRFDEVRLNGEVVKNLSAVSARIKKDTGNVVTAAELQEILFKEGGTDDLYALNGVEFGLTETDSDGKTFTYNVQVFKAPKEDEPATE